MKTLDAFYDFDVDLKKQQFSFFSTSISSLKDTAFIPLPSDWASNNRYLPSTVSENYGKWDKNKVKPHADILDYIHPDNPVTHITVMKSVQSGLTVSLGENAMGYFTKYRLGSVAYFTSTKNVGKARSNSALDVMIDNSGLAELIKPMSNRTNRKSADTAFAKEFAGGIRWQLSSYGSIADMKSNTFNLLVKDELDEAPPEIAGQGDTEDVIEGRTMGVRMFKVLNISTPSSMETSRIYKNFIMGDQCRYFVPCPHCGGEQYFKFAYTKDNAGLTFDMKKDPNTGAKILDTTSIRYVCEHCGSSFREYQKEEIVKKGEWRPTWQESEYKPKSPKHKSFHIPGILSPFLAWSRICQQYINTNFGQDIMKFKDFTINYLGEPWARVTKMPKWQEFKKRADDYVMNCKQAPTGVHRIYGGVDVQKDRLELAVVGVGIGMEKWLIDYQVFYGDTSKLNNLVWKNFATYISSTKYDSEDGKTPISMVAIDTGFDPRASVKRAKDWDTKAHIVYDFIATYRQIGVPLIPIKGTGITKGADLLRAMRTSHTVVTKRIDITVDMLKELLSDALELHDGYGAIHFPKWSMIDDVKIPTPDEIFKQFLSERYQEVSPNKMGWKPIRSRNEVWDTFIYATACMYIDGIQSWDETAWGMFIKEKRRVLNKV